MAATNSWKTIIVIGTFGLVAWLGILPSGELNAASQIPVPTKTPPVPPPPPTITKTPPPISGGEWRDDWFNSEQLYTTSNVWAPNGRLALRVVESLNWKQTWTAHFAPGEFFQTEAVSDSVQLARVSGTLQYFTTGIYTSTVFDAGRPVDWLSADWIYWGMWYSVTVEFRIGNTAIPDQTWSNWGVSEKICTRRIDTDWTRCTSFRLAIGSSRYFQYRVTFTNNDPNRTLIFDEITIAYGIYVPFGYAISRAIPPTDLQSWKEVFYSSTVPISTALTIDVLATDGTVLLSNVNSGDSLAGINPSAYPSLQLRATLATNDLSRTPELDMWGIRWFTNTRLYFFPMILR